jgi:hypothetical protein
LWLKPLPLLLLLLVLPYEALLEVSGDEGRGARGKRSAARSWARVYFSRGVCLVAINLEQIGEEKEAKI